LIRVRAFINQQHPFADSAETGGCGRRLLQARLHPPVLSLIRVTALHLTNNILSRIQPKLADADVACFRLGSIRLFCP
jgi:hypothetical protein